MYTNSSNDSDQFNIMQNKIKETIDSMVSNSHIKNPYNNHQTSDNNIPDTTNKFY